MCFEYSNKQILNNNFVCVYCKSGAHGFGKEGIYICFECIKLLVKLHDEIVKSEFKIIQKN